MGQIGSIMSRDSNRRGDPGSHATVLITTKAIVSEESSEQVRMRNIAGQVFTIDAGYRDRKRIDNSMMPEGLASPIRSSRRWFSFPEMIGNCTFMN